MDGGVFAILGASGCGKSMTLKCIAGIERPDEGRIVLNDRVLFDSKKKINLPPQKRKVGYMFQDYALFPNMNVVQNIQSGMGRKPDQKKAVSYTHLRAHETLIDTAYSITKAIHFISAVRYKQGWLLNIF